MIRAAQVLLVLSAAALWLASRATWVEVYSFDGLGVPKTTTLNGSGWSTALIPLALVLLAAAVAALAVRGWPLRLLSVVVAVASAGMAYLAISLWVLRDLAVRAAALAEVPLMQLTGTARSYAGATVTLLAALGTLAAAVLLMRAAATGRSGVAKYTVPSARRATALQEDADTVTSERMIWDALDEGRDPTNPHS